MLDGPQMQALYTLMMAVAESSVAVDEWLETYGIREIVPQRVDSRFLPSRRKGEARTLPCQGAARAASKAGGRSFGDRSILVLRAWCRLRRDPHLKTEHRGVLSPDADDRWLRVLSIP